MKLNSINIKLILLINKASNVIRQCQQRWLSLVCLAVLAFPINSYADNIDCTAEATRGTLSDNFGSYSNSVIADCVNTKNIGFLFDSNFIYATSTQDVIPATDQPITPTNLGTISDISIIDTGASKPSFNLCSVLNYAAAGQNPIGSTAGHWYCAEFKGSIHTGYLYAQFIDDTQHFANPNPITKLLDIDGNGNVVALEDGLLILRYLFGFRGTSLTSGAIGTGATRTTSDEIVNYLE